MGQAVDEIIADAAEIDDIFADVAAEERMPKKAKQKFCKFCRNPSKSMRNCKWHKDACKRICKIDPCSLAERKSFPSNFEGQLSLVVSFDHHPFEKNEDS